MHRTSCTIRTATRALLSTLCLVLLPGSALAVDIVEHDLNPEVPQDAEVLEIVARPIPVDFQRYPVLAIQRSTTITIEDGAVREDGKGGGGKVAWVKQWHAVDKIQHAAGMEHTNFAFGYPGGHGQVLINERRRIRDDNTYVRTTVHEMTDGRMSNNDRASYHGFSRQKKLTLKDVEPGDYTEMKVRSQSKRKMAYAGYGGLYQFGELPALTETVCYQHSDKVFFRYRLADPNDAVTVQTDSVEVDGVELQRTCFSVEQLHAEILDNDTPRGELRGPRVSVSTWEDWDHLGKWMSDKYSGRLDPSPEIREQVAELTDGLEGDDAIRVVFHWVAENVRYVQTYLEMNAGYVPAEADEVFERRFGDCKEQTTILIAMLDALGVEAHPVLIGTTRLPQAALDFPMMYQFNHMITYLPEQDLFLDTVGDDNPFPYLLPMDQDRNVLILQGKKLVQARTPLMTPEASRLHRLRKLSLALGSEPDSPLELVYDVVYEHSGGNAEQWHRKRSYSPERLDEYMAHKWVDDGILEDYSFDHDLGDFTQPVVVRYRYRKTAQDVARIGGARPSHIMLPKFIGLPRAATFYASPERKDPFEWAEFPELIEERHEVTLPPGYRLAYLPDGVNYEHPEGVFAYQADFAREGDDLLVITERLELSQPTIDAALFLSLRPIIAKLSAQVENRLLLVAEDPPETP